MIKIKIIKTIDLGSKNDWESPPDDFSLKLNTDKPCGLAMGGDAGYGDGIFNEEKI